jgi:hypothetical protein
MSARVLVSKRLFSKGSREHQKRASPKRATGWPSRLYSPVQRRQAGEDSSLK